MTIDKSQIKRILFITLSNMGDIILTTPVLRVLEREFPSSRIDVMVGPNGRDVFNKDPRIFKLIIYDKHVSMMEKRRLALKLKKLKYDIVVDVRNTVLPILLGPKYRTNPIQSFPGQILHKRDKHLYRLRSLGLEGLSENSYVYVSKEDEEYVDRIIKENGLADPIVLVNPGARNPIKKWTVGGFAEVTTRLVNECKASVVFIGLEEDAESVSSIMQKIKVKAHNFVNRTNIRQLASLAKRSSLLITNDSAPLHLGCAAPTRVLAIFGPTDPRKYGPTGEFDVVVNKKLFCSPCESADCKYDHECMKLISADEVFDAAKMMVEGYE